MNEPVSVWCRFAFVAVAVAGGGWCYRRLRFEEERVDLAGYVIERRQVVVLAQSLHKLGFGPKKVLHG
jgi:hypothetical protein